MHPRDNDLVLATHGRSIYIMDDITPLQAFTSDIMMSDSHLFEPRDAVMWRNDRRQNRAVTGNKFWTGESAPAGTAIHYWLSDEASEANLTITNAVTGEEIRTMEGTGEAGMNRVQWDLRGNPPQGGGGRGRGGGFGGRGRQGQAVSPGIYRVQLSVGGDDFYTTVTVLEDIWMN